MQNNYDHKVTMKYICDHINAHHGLRREINHDRLHITPMSRKHFERIGVCEYISVMLNDKIIQIAQPILTSYAFECRYNPHYIPGRYYVIDKDNTIPKKQYMIHGAMGYIVKYLLS